MSAPETDRLRRALVVATTEDTCTLVAEGQQVVLPYAPFFPTPRAERVAPGHLVAVAGPVDVVVWRWFDAVVLGQADSQVRLWEPGHGEVLAQPRDPHRVAAPGSRAYLSAGLPGSEWWVAGGAVARAEEADVELAEVEHFLTEHDLWTRLV